MEEYLEKVRWILELNDYLRITTDQMRLSEFECAKSFFINPEGFSWNQRFLSVFINQLYDYHLDPKNGFRHQKSSSGCDYYFVKFFNSYDLKFYIAINISSSIRVNVRKEFTSNWTTDTPKKSQIRKYINLELSETSKALMSNTTLLYYDPLSYLHAFSENARSYAAGIVSSYNKDNMQI